MAKIAIEEAKKILAKHGMEVSDEQVKEIIDFVYTMAHIAVAQQLREEDKDAKGNAEDKE